MWWTPRKDGRRLQWNEDKSLANSAVDDDSFIPNSSAKDESLANSLANSSAASGATRPWLSFVDMKAREWTRRQEEDE